MSARSQILLSLGAFVAGYLFSFLGEYVRSRTAKQDRDLERTNRNLDRKADHAALLSRQRDKRLAKHYDNQLTWMVELQEVLSDFMRTFGEIEIADLSAIRHSGQEKIRLPLLDDALNEKANVLQRRAIVLASRIDSDEVRDGVGKLMNRFSQYGVRAEVSGADIMDRGSRVIELFPSNIQIIGERIRRLADETDQ